ncbi:MAG: hypothetical protein IPL96_04115 [Holophagaceae bacterium]|nr:hypothetical protein [Holophagaceae bacterium]
MASPHLDGAHARGSPVFYTALLALAMVAFWPGYLAVPKLQLSGWLHFHAVTGTLWLLLLIVQPWAILSGRRALHRALGRATYLLFPLVLAGFVGLAHASMQGKTPQGQAVDAYFFFVRVVLVTLFTLAWVLGVLHRREPEVHGRYMACTGLALIDPVLHRLAARAMGGADLNYQLLTFGVVATLLVLLIARSWKSIPGRRALAVMLAGYVLGGLPLALDFYKWGRPWTAWKRVAASFAALPLP